MVGAGTAGSVVAARLSENPSWNVLLLEAGGDPPIESMMPNMFFALQNPNSSVNWGYHAERSTTASLSLKRGCYWPRGKMLGGSGSMNAMVHVRGSDRDFNQWEEAGNPTWGWSNVLNYFKKSEGMRVPDIANSNGGRFHNTRGPLKIDSFRYQEPIKQVVLDAAKELGYKTLIDISAEEYIGMTVVPGTLDEFTRCSTAKAFLVPAKNRPNLHVIKNAHVTKIALNANRMVTGVEFVVNNRKLTVGSTKEVILSAGAVGTPQLLMLSGIGPKEVLKPIDIKVVQNLAVGKNLQDHPVVGIPLTYDKSNSKMITDNAFLENLFKYTNREFGTAGHGVFDVLGFFNTRNATDRYPDLETHYNYFKRGENVLLPKYLDELLGYDDALAKSIIDANQDADIIFVLLILLNPKSAGRIQLRSADPFDRPLIRTNYLENIDDVETLMRGIKLTRDFLQTKPFRDHEMAAVKLNIPACNALLTNSAEYDECLVRHLVTTLFHPTSTAKMGPATDRTAVVDARLRVRGIKGLRVADASIMPNIVSANTNAAIVMIGEKASDFVKEDWGAAKSVHTEL